jgi:hypothetical protein
MRQELTDNEKQKLVAALYLNKLYAPALAELSVRVVESITDESQRNLCFLTLIDYLAAHGNLALADEIARHRLNGYHRAAALAGLGIASAAVDSDRAQAYLVDAEAFLERTSDPDDRTTLLHRISQGYSRLRMWEKGQELAGQVGQAQDRAFTLCRLLEDLWNAGESEKANRLLLAARESVAATSLKERASALDDLARVLALMKRGSEAFELWEEAVASAEYAPESAKLLYLICKGLVSIGHQQRAHEVALLIKNDARKAQALALVGNP